MTRSILALTTVVSGLLVAAPEARADNHRRLEWGFNVGFGMATATLQAVFGRPAVYGCPAPVVYARPIWRRPVVVAPVVLPPVVHVHHSVPIYRQVWVPARFEQRLIGYSTYGRPIYQTVEVSCGHYESVVAGYRCDGCGSCL
jgi:hypothetical protein